MSPGIQIVTEISFENPSQMRLSEHDDVVEAFPANTSNQTLGQRILPRTPWSSEHFRDSHALNPVSEVAAVNSVPITDQIAGAVSSGNASTICCAAHSAMASSVT